MLSSILNFMLAWFNLPFTLLLAICLLLAGLQWVGLGGDHETDGEAGADSDLDHDLDGHLDHDLDADGDYTHDVDAHFDHDVEAEFDHDLDHDLGGEAEHATIDEIHHGLDSGGGGEAGFSILAYLGVGRAPLLVILLLLFGSVGLTGWLFNVFTVQILGAYPGPLFFLALVVALGLGSLVSSRITRAIGRTLPPVSTTATSARALVGKRGIVISPFVDPRYGMVHLRDAAGTLISVFAVTAEDPPIRRGEEVLFIEYEPENHLYHVIRAPR